MTDTENTKPAPSSVPSAQPDPARRALLRGAAKGAMIGVPTVATLLASSTALAASDTCWSTHYAKYTYQLVTKGKEAGLYQVFDGATQIKDPSLISAFCWSSGFQTPPGPYTNLTFK